jgi:hypothetical protein
VAGLRCGGQPDDELPWRRGSKRGKFIKGDITLSERKPSRAGMRACLDDINECGKAALSYAHQSKALRLLREQVSVPYPARQTAAAAAATPCETPAYDASEGTHQPTRQRDGGAYDISHCDVPAVRQQQLQQQHAGALRFSFG